MADVLVVDDLLDVRHSLRDILESAGHLVRLARTGLEAVRKHLARPADVITLDMRMPRYDGIDTAKAIRTHDLAVRLVPVSAFRDAYIDRAEDLDLSGWISKPLLTPVTIESFVEAVNRASVEAQVARVSTFLRQFEARLDKRDLKALERISRRISPLTGDGGLDIPYSGRISGLIQLAILHGTATMLRDSKIGEDLFFQCFAVELGDLRPLIHELNQMGLKEMVRSHKGDLMMLTRLAKGGSR